MATGVAPLEGAIDFNFREAINALTHSSADAAMLASRWYDLCNTEEELDVTVSLSNGQSMTVPNLGKAIAALKRRTGDIDASSVKVHGANWGTGITDDGVDVGTARASFPDGAPRQQHAYTTPYNEYYDCGWVSNSAYFHDPIAFFEVPRFIFFGAQSSISSVGQHTLAIKPIPANASILRPRTDRQEPILAMQFTVTNSDPVRPVRINITGDQAEMQIQASVLLTPGMHASFLVWGQRGASSLAVVQL